MKRKITMAKEKNKTKIIPQGKSRGIIVLSKKDNKKIKAVTDEIYKLKRILED